jgi:hypothetical protein
MAATKDKKLAVARQRLVLDALADELVEVQRQADINALALPSRQIMLGRRRS